MPAAAGLADRRRQARFWLLLLFVLSADLVAGIAWFASPLAFGFALSWPADAVRRACAEAAYTASYFVGLPALAISLAAAPLLSAMRRHRAARVALLAPLAFFAVAAAAFLILVT